MVGERQEYPILPAAGWNVLTPVYDFLCSAVGLGKRFKRWLIELANVESSRSEQCSQRASKHPPIGSTATTTARQPEDTTALAD